VNILIVDDSKVSRLLLKEQVEALNYSVVGEAKDGSEAMALFEKLKPDIILTDIEMPIIDGIELTRKIHAEYKNVKIIVISAVVNKKMTERAVLSGAFTVLQKPIDGKRLKKALSMRL